MTPEEIEELLARIDELSEGELLEIVSREVKKAAASLNVANKSMKETIKELSELRKCGGGLKAVLKNPERYVDIIEELEIMLDPDMMRQLKGSAKDVKQGG